MNMIQRAGVIAIILFFLVGCSPKQTVPVIEALAEIPFVDRSETEVNDWFKGRTIIDDKPYSSGFAINGSPEVSLVTGYRVIEGVGYAGWLCVTQTNTLPGGQSAKYGAMIGIDVLNNTTLFECGDVEISQVSCDGDPTPINITSFRDKAELQSAFEKAITTWLQNDIVTTLKSTHNTDGFANAADAKPRAPAKTRGVKYAISASTTMPVKRTIGFIAE